MSTPIICRTYRQPANQCKCFRCRPQGDQAPHPMLRTAALDFPLPS